MKRFFLVFSAILFSIPFASLLGAYSAKAATPWDDIVYTTPSLHLAGQYCTKSMNITNNPLAFLTETTKGTQLTAQVKDEIFNAAANNRIAFFQQGGNTGQGHDTNDRRVVIAYATEPFTYNNYYTFSSSVSGGSTIYDIRFNLTSGQVPNILDTSLKSVSLVADVGGNCNKDLGWGDIFASPSGVPGYFMATTLSETSTFSQWHKVYRSGFPVKYPDGWQGAEVPGVDDVDFEQPERTCADWDIGCYIASAFEKMQDFTLPIVDTIQGFFDNLIAFVMRLFIPDAQYMQTAFALLMDNFNRSVFGVLTLPVQFVVALFQSFLGLNQPISCTANPTYGGCTWGGTWTTQGKLGVAPGTVMYIDWGMIERKYPLIWQWGTAFAQGMMAFVVLVLINTKQKRYIR